MDEMVFFPFRERKLNPKEIQELIKKLAKKYNVPVPEWRIVGEKPKKEKIEKPRFGPITTFERKTIDVLGSFLVASDGTCCIEFYGPPTEETIKHEFKHYVDWLRGHLERESI
ncbi:hypothetical protein J7K27_04470 [Candidatus Bathyarchaeota archaeon]|nr:hypothetical protein [Candidatus Bathyarchaeota archaeon]